MWAQLGTSDLLDQIGSGKKKPQGTSNEFLSVTTAVFKSRGLDASMDLCTHKLAAKLQNRMCSQHCSPHCSACRQPAQQNIHGNLHLRGDLMIHLRGLLVSHRFSHIFRSPTSFCQVLESFCIFKTDMQVDTLFRDLMEQQQLL